MFQYNIFSQLNWPFPFYSLPKSPDVDLIFSGDWNLANNNNNTVSHSHAEGEDEDVSQMSTSDEYSELQTSSKPRRPGEKSVSGSRHNEVSATDILSKKIRVKNFYKDFWHTQNYFFRYAGNQWFVNRSSLAALSWSQQGSDSGISMSSQEMKAGAYIFFSSDNSFFLICMVNGDLTIFYSYFLFDLSFPLFFIFFSSPFCPVFQPFLPLSLLFSPFSYPFPPLSPLPIPR